MSVWPAKLSQSMTGQRTAAAAKRTGGALTPRPRTPPARAPPDLQPPAIDVTPAEHAIDPGRQVVVVHTGIRVHDGIAEGAPIARAAARVGIEHHEAVRGEILEGVIEPRGIGAVGPPMDLQNQRVFPGRVEGRRLDDPALYLGPAARVVPELFDLS